MARRTEPWFREERGQWYVWHDGRQVELAADKDEAFEKWHDRMALSRVTTAGDKNPFKVVAEQFLDWISRNKKLKTYRPHLQAFCDVHGGVQLRHPPGIAHPYVVTAQEAVLSLIAVDAGVVAQSIVGGEDHASLPARDHLRRVERERARNPERAGRSAVVSGAVGVGGVFEQPDAASITEGADGVDLGGDEAADMD